MQVEMSSRKGKRDLTTLDLLSSCSSILHCPLDLNLLPEDGHHEPPPARPLAGNQSLCTIDKVKRALERASREAQLRRPPSRGEGVVVTVSFLSPAASSPSSSSSSRSSSVTAAPPMKRLRKAAAPAGEDSDGSSDTAAAAVLVAAGCAVCLSYVLAEKGNPRCPRCQSQVQLTGVAPPERRPGIDLNCAL